MSSDKSSRKPMTVVRRIWYTSAALIANIVILGAVGIFVEHQFDEYVHALADNYLPAMEHASKIDMMHDGLKGTVFNAILAKEGVQVETMESVKKDLDEYSETMKKSFEALKALNLSETVSRNIAEAEPEVMTYIGKANGIFEKIAASSSKKPPEADLEDFLKQFRVLEGKLEKLGESVATASEQVKGDSVRFSNLARTANGILVGFCVLIGLWLTASTNRTLTTKLRDMVGRINRQSEALTQISGTLDNAADQLSSTTTQQAAAIEETVSSMEEMSAMLKQTSSNSQAPSALPKKVGRTRSPPARSWVVSRAPWTNSLKPTKPS